MSADLCVYLKLQHVEQMKLEHVEQMQNVSADLCVQLKLEHVELAGSEGSAKSSHLLPALFHVQK